MIQDIWYANTVIYSLDVETYLDTDGDGIGDFEGLIRRLDYIEALGVDAIWLSPFQKTPNKDNGYDVADYYTVDSRLGTNGDFVQFVKDAESRGIRVLMDLVINHTSDQHPWFKQARSNPDCRFRDWYIWSKKRPDDWDQGMVFPGFQKGVWTRDAEAKMYYFHRFYKFQPDLNMENPAVREEVLRIMGYWLQQGVAGFRVDAVPFVIETVKPGKENPPKHFEYLYEMNRMMRWRRGDGVLLGEANVPPRESKAYFGEQGAGLQMMFNFWVNQRLFYALATDDIKPLVSALEATREIPEGAVWGQFLRNHDELDLGRLSDTQRERVFDRFAPDEDMQLYDRGIRRRLAPMLGNRRQLELAYSLMFSLPGCPVLRYGDEIGMGDDLQLPQRDAVRTPMQWSNHANAGFSTADKLVRPIIDHGVFDYHRVNVEAQLRDPASLLNWTVKMIRLRKQCPEIGRGKWEILKTDCRTVLAMRYDWRGNAIVILHNLADQAVNVNFRPGDHKDDVLTDLLELKAYPVEGRGRHSITLEAFGYKWLRLGSTPQHLARRRA